MSSRISVISKLLQMGLHRTTIHCASRSFRLCATPILVYNRELEQIENERLSTLKSDEIFYDHELTEKEKNFQAFKSVIDQYKQREGVYRRGHTEFIYTALAKMKDYNVHKDLDSYKALLSVFPEGVMKARTMWQVESKHYPKQQDCAIDIMEDMERYGVCPDDEFGQMLEKVFSAHVHAFRKYRRMMYWLPKLKHVDPYPIPYPLPTDPAELAVVALKRMAIDFENKVLVHRRQSGMKKELQDAFIASSQSPKQKELIARHDINKPLYVEGAFNVWTRRVRQSYFILSGDPRVLPPPPTKEQIDYLDVRNWTKIFDDEDVAKEMIEAPSMHELEDRTVLGMCITESSTKDSLMSWIRILQDNNPKLRNIMIVFQLRSQEQGVEVYGADNQGHALNVSKNK